MAVPDGASKVSHMRNEVRTNPPASPAKAHGEWMLSDRYRLDTNSAREVLGNRPHAPTDVQTLVSSEQRQGHVAYKNGDGGQRAFRHRSFVDFPRTAPRPRGRSAKPRVSPRQPSRRRALLLRGSRGATRNERSSAKLLCSSSNRARGQSLGTDDQHHVLSRGKDDSG
jgi:hypothetical protein